jgi:N-acyl-phosphatidylethanolamine-hydrolysing phospholipase D
MVFWLLISCLALASGCGQPTDAFEVPPHRSPQGFHNLYLKPPQERPLGFFRWKLGLGPHESPALPTEEVPPYRPQIATPDLNHINGPDPRRIQVTWIGHSTFLVQVAGLNLLTDPIFSERASPVTFAGPRRYAPPGLSWGQLPRIDAVVISHNHYDHLDLATVTRLGNRIRFFVPLGVAAWFREAGINNVVELDWGQQAEFGPLTFHCVPAQHFSARGLRDRNAVLWCSWVLETPGGKVFFSCDTGYSPDARDIGEAFGPFRLSLLPIGGYQPRWFMGNMHVNPPEAVKMHRDLRSDQSLGMHWGTFKLTDEPMGEPPLYLARALKEAAVSAEEFQVLKIGETRVFP